MGRKFLIAPHHMRTDGIPDDRLRVGDEAELTQVELELPQTPLLSLLHARKCILNTQNNKCDSPRCSAAKTVLRHLETCVDSMCCFPHCHSSRILLAHYETCRSQTCSLCVPLQRVFSRTPPTPPHALLGTQLVHQWINNTNAGLAI